MVAKEEVINKDHSHKVPVVAKMVEMVSLLLFLSVTSVLKLHNRILIDSSLNADPLRM